MLSFNQNRLREEKMDKLILNVEGMSCMHCENAVKSAVKQIEGVNGVEASFEKKEVVVEYSGNLNIDQVCEAIIEEGYTVVK